ncbi:MAG: PadR family transcriptional regulator [Candidatus Diapherotrites archaeon]|nr:PadR family transcriptional regulator [Candidatus Diapherotrites archaeon]
MNLFARGLLKIYVLYMAKQGSISGSDVAKSISAATDGRWKPSFGSIYPLLGRFEEDGLLCQEARKGKQVFYSLTKKGVKEFERQREKYIAEYEDNLGTLFPLVFQLAQFEADKELQDAVTNLNQVFAKYKKYLFNLELNEKVEKRKRIIKDLSATLSDHMSKLEK